jgi:hypothetical protein
MSGFDLLAGADCMVETPPGLGLAVLSGLTHNACAHRECPTAFPLLLLQVASGFDMLAGADCMVVDTQH